MSSEVERLRALLAEAREYIIAVGCPDDAMLDRIDAALAEPVVECARCETLRELADTAAAEQGLAQRRMMEAQKQRDEARAHLAAVEKLLPREAYIGDQTAAENFAGYIEGLKRERDHARTEVERLRDALLTIERSGAPGASIFAKRNDGHTCSWCRGVWTPCPTSAAAHALAGKEKP